MIIIFYILTFIIGLIIGSFLNALDYGLKHKKSLFRIHSECPKCKHNLKALDLVPLFSYFFLQGRCRYCKKPISIQYPLVELGTGILFFLITLSVFPLNMAIGTYLQTEIFIKVATVLFWFYLASAFMLIVLSDLREMIIPDNIIWPSVIAALVVDLAASLAVYLQGGNFALFFGFKILGALAAGGFFYALVTFSKGKWMGGGDVKLALLMGLALGWPNILVGLMIAFITGSLFGLTAILAKKKSFADSIPFGPFLVFGALVAFLYSSQIITWYADKMYDLTLKIWH